MASPEQVELTRLIGQKFVSRRDVKAFQRPNGAWYPVGARKSSDPLYQEDPQFIPMKMSDFVNHLTGVQTMGHYLLGADGTAKFFALDIDLRKPNPEPGSGEPYVPVGPDGVPYNPREVWLDPEHPLWPALCVELRTVADGLAYSINRRLGLQVAISDSGGKGLHVYAFTGPQPGEVLRELATGIVTDLGMEPALGVNFFRPGSWESNVDVEIFPKQDSLDGKKLGNLLSLPLGVNQKSKRPSRFITLKAPTHRLVTMDPHNALSGDLPWE